VVDQAFRAVEEIARQYPGTQQQAADGNQQEVGKNQGKKRHDGRDYRWGTPTPLGGVALADDLGLRVNFRVLNARTRVMPGHTGLGGPPLVRLLARLANTEVRESAQALPERLSQWLGWADAIALAAALKNGKRAIEQATAGEGASCAEVRAELTQAILEDELLVVRPPSRSRMQARRAVVRNDDPDYVLYRQCYLALQQRMEIAIGALRAGLRT